MKSNQRKRNVIAKNALRDEKLSNFLRMLNVLSHKKFDNINSYALILVHQDRNLLETKLKINIYEILVIFYTILVVTYSV